MSSTSNSPMYSFIIEELIVDSEGVVKKILNQALIFGHNEPDALRRHFMMYPDVQRNPNVCFKVYPHFQLTATEIKQ